MGAEAIVESHFTQCASIISFLPEPHTGLTCRWIEVVEQEGHANLQSIPLKGFILIRLYAYVVSEIEDDGTCGWEDSPVS